MNRAVEGVYKRYVKVDLLIDVPAAGPVLLHSVPVLFRSESPSTDLQPSYQDVANAITRGSFLPPEVRFSFLKGDGSLVENLQDEKLQERKAVLRLTKAQDLPRPCKFFKRS